MQLLKRPKLSISKKIPYKKIFTGAFITVLVTAIIYVTVVINTAVIKTKLKTGTNNKNVTTMYHHLDSSVNVLTLKLDSLSNNINNDWQQELMRQEMILFNAGITVHENKIYVLNKDKFYHKFKVKTENGVK